MSKVKRIMISIPIAYLELLDNLVNDGKYMSRSEIIRLALRDFFKKNRIIQD